MEEAKVLDNLSRRRFLIQAGTATSALACLFSNIEPVEAMSRNRRGILDLPKGFSYEIIERTGDRMSDGHEVPALPDGMACFKGKNGKLILMRNHEVHKGKPANNELAYRKNRGGGVSRLVVSAKSGRRISSNMILTGTSRNCAGGATPYGWISCEEAREPYHGYAFLCDPHASSLQAPKRLDALGKFVHEAAAFDPKTGITYLTEDTTYSAIYRHVPDSPKRPFRGGKLQALKVKGKSKFPLSKGQKIGHHFDVEWVNIDDRYGRKISTRKQAQARGAAILSRGEGIWYQNKSVYIVSTDGGPRKRGQLYRLDVRRGKSDRLTLLTQAVRGDKYRNIDNITMTPWGDAYMAEDGGAGNSVQVFKPDGRVIPFVRNLINRGKSEFTGVCFSPDHKMLFLNIQHEGLTVVIKGDFSHFG